MPEDDEVDEEEDIPFATSNSYSKINFPSNLDGIEAIDIDAVWPREWDGEDEEDEEGREAEEMSWESARREASKSVLFAAK